MTVCVNYTRADIPKYHNGFVCKRYLGKNHLERLSYLIGYQHYFIGDG